MEWPRQNDLLKVINQVNCRAGKATQLFPNPASPLLTALTLPQLLTAIYMAFCHRNLVKKHLLMKCVLRGDKSTAQSSKAIQVDINELLKSSGSQNKYLLTTFIKLTSMT